MAWAQAPRPPADNRVAEAFRRMLPPMTPEQIAALPKWSVQKMQARDGVTLAANVFLPAGPGPFPAIVSRTPYLKDILGDLAGAQAKKYVDAGYAFVLQDVRGKGMSGGSYDPFTTDIEDGYDTIEWVAAQPWSNGKVGIGGSSALGITANMAAMAAPPHLVAAFVMLAPQDMLHSTFPGGVLRERDTLGWAAGQGVAPERLTAKRGEALNSAIWAKTAMTTHRKFIQVPIYNVGGWYDVFSQGAVENFRWLQTSGSSGARGRQKLYMAAAGHGGLGGDLSDVDYPQAGAAFPEGEELRWWDHWLKGVDTGLMREPPVTVFMMGASRKGAASTSSRPIQLAGWPPPGRPERYYLNADMTLGRARPRRAKAELSYRFDPAKPVPTLGGYNQLLPAGPLDQRPIGQREDYLRFETPPLEEDVPIAGAVTVELWASTDGPDTDFMAKLVDVHPDGYEQIVLENPIRARFRGGRDPDDVRMMTPGKPELLTLDLWNTAYTFEAGHKIQLAVTSSNSPKFEINPNTGEPFGVRATQKPRVATNTIHVDRARPSAVILPRL